MTDGKPDIKKLKPLVYCLDQTYYKLGEPIAKALSIGKEYKKN